MKKIIIALTLLYTPIILLGQTISLVLPKESNKKFHFTINNGLKIDTIARGNISMMGTAKITLPAKYKSIPAVGELHIEGGESLDLMLNNETFTVQEGTVARQYVFKGSLENDLLYNRKAELAEPKYSSTYSHAYMKMLNSVLAMSQVITKGGTVYQRNAARHSAMNDIDIDKLYYSKFWYFVIDGLMKLSVGEEGFANDMVKLLDKTKTEKVYVSFVEDLITITNQFGMDNAFDIIIPHVEASGRIKYPQGEVYDAFAMAKVRKGVVGPQLKGLKTPLGGTEDNYTLVIFHQPGCDNCEQQLELLKTKISFFKKNKVRIVSLSGALDTEAYEKETKSFPWIDKLCDLKGFAGANFQNYGIIGTPTIYLLNKKNVVLGRFARISDVERHIYNL